VRCSFSRHCHTQPGTTLGPINAAAGHRRLNVLFTRAKEKVSIFSSMTPEDIVPTETSRLGVDILKHYLAYARDGRLEFGVPSGREPDSDFEPTFKESG
jgi:superfamily I DNA and/or RNA helicase